MGIKTHMYMYQIHGETIDGAELRKNLLLFQGQDICAAVMWHQSCIGASLWNFSRRMINRYEKSQELSDSCDFFKFYSTEIITLSHSLA